MKILGIDTSCDETSISIVEIRGKNFQIKKIKILANIISSQVKIHKKYGGVFPFLAKREHQKNLIPVFKEALKESFLLETKGKKITEKESEILKKIFKKDEELSKNFLKFLENYWFKKIDLIGITIGPGLEPCLWTGINFVKAISFLGKIKIMPVNHIKAHIYANWLENKEILKEKNLFPAIALVVSGGHTELILMKDFNKLKILGQTRDDAAGECFDKVARILGLPYPGGPEIEKMAKKFELSNLKEKRLSQDYSVKLNFSLPRPMIYHKNYDFSFSGLKTALFYKIKENPKLKNKKYLPIICFEVQQAIIDVLISKTIKAAKEFGANSIILGGGVAANEKLKRDFKLKIEKELPKAKFFSPLPIFCTDNGAMVALAAFFDLPFKKTKKYDKIIANPNLKIC